MTHLNVGVAATSSLTDHANVVIEEINLWPAKLADADLTEITGS